MWDDYYERLCVCGIHPVQALSIVDSFFQKEQEEEMEQYATDCEVGFLCG